MNIKLSYDESNYDGRYEYINDPKHEKRPIGIGWYITPNGWARGSNAKHKPTKVIKNIPKAKPTTKHCEMLLDISENIAVFISKDITNFKSAVNVVADKVENARNKYRNFDNMIVGFADQKKSKVAPKLSAMMAYIFALSPDFRNKGNPIMDYCKKTINEAKEYIAFEQEIIRMTGLLNDDDTITLFRNTDEKQFENSQLCGGDVVNYKGNNFESWTTNPDLTLSIDRKRKIKICAKVPINACLASCIGREKGREFMYKDSGECEIMVCGAFIKEAMIIGDNTGIKIDGARDIYFQEYKSNMKKFANKHKKRDGNITGGVLTTRLAKIAQNILSDLSR